MTCLVRLTANPKSAALHVDPFGSAMYSSGHELIHGARDRAAWLDERWAVHDCND